MSLDKAIRHGKEKRAQYRGSARLDVSCRNHGGGRAYPCPWCERNRTIVAKRLAQKGAGDDEV